MAGGAGFDVHSSALEAAAARLEGESGVLSGLGGRASSAAGRAAGGVNGGALAGALEQFGGAVQSYAQQLARQITTTAGSVRDSSSTYQDKDAATRQLMNSWMGGGGGGFGGGGASGSW